MKSREDISNTKLTISVKTMVGIIGFVIVAALGWFQLDSKASAAIEKASEATKEAEKLTANFRVMSCDLRQLKRFVIEGIKPSQTDNCEDRGR